MVCNPLKRHLPKIVLEQRRLVGKEVRQIIPLGPTRPGWILARHADVRIQVVHKVGVVRADAVGGVVVLDAVEDLEDIRAVKGTHDGRAPVIRG